MALWTGLVWLRRGTSDFSSEYFWTLCTSKEKEQCRAEGRYVSLGVAPLPFYVKTFSVQQFSSNGKQIVYPESVFNSRIWQFMAWNLNKINRTDIFRFDYLLAILECCTKRFLKLLNSTWVGVKKRILKMGGIFSWILQLPYCTMFVVCGKVKKSCPSSFGRFTRKPPKAGLNAVEKRKFLFPSVLQLLPSP
jgi:hypothetical protein